MSEKVGESILELMRDPKKYVEFMFSILEKVPEEYREVVAAMVLPSPQKIGFYSQTVPTILESAKQTRNEILKEVLSGYDEKSLEVIKSAFRLISDSGHAYLWAAYLTASDLKNIIGRERYGNYRVREDIANNIFRGVLPALALYSGKYVNDYVIRLIPNTAELFLRGRRTEFRESLDTAIINYVEGMMKTMLMNNDIENPTVLLEKYKEVLKLFGSTLVKLYDLMGKYNTSEETEEKIPLLTINLINHSKDFMNLESIINNIIRERGKKEEGKKEEGSEETKKLPMEEKKEEEVKEKLEEKPPAPYIP